MMKGYEEVLPDLTQEEIDSAMDEAKRKKRTRLDLEAWNEQIKKSVNWDRPSAREIYEALRSTKSQSGELFKLTDWNRKVIHDLCLYFAGDARFEERGEGYSLSKGIMITGTPGAGKSHLMAFFSKNPHTSYSHVTCKAVAECYRTGWKRDELDTLEWYSFTLKAEAGHYWDQKELGYCFGDLGTEDEKNNFGNKMNVMEHIIFQRYENKLPFNMTHLTTNLNATEIEATYGLRVRDRLREMCNKIVLEGPSFR